MTCENRFFPESKSRAVLSEYSDRKGKRLEIFYDSKSLIRIKRLFRTRFLKVLAQ